MPRRRDASDGEYFSFVLRILRIPEYLLIVCLSAARLHPVCYPLRSAMLANEARLGATPRRSALTRNAFSLGFALVSQGHHAESH